MNPDFSDILSAFSAERVEFLVVGAYALAAHGLPRAVELALHGDSVAARAAAQRALDYFTERRDSVPTYGIASAALTAGRPDLARQYLAGPHGSTSPNRSRTWVHGDSPWLTIAAILALQAGDTATADRLEDSLRHGQWTHEWARHLFEAARLAAYRGDRGGAMAQLGQLSSITCGSLWPHYWAGLASLRGFPPFEELLRPRR